MTIKEGLLIKNAIKLFISAVIFVALVNGIIDLYYILREIF